MSESALAETIVNEFGLPEKPRSSVVPKQKVLDWMKADDIEALGALYSFVMKDNYANRIQPALSFSDYWDLISRYFERCFRENPRGEWTHGRYDAGWDLTSWVTRIWKDDSVTTEDRTRIKEWLAAQYKGGDADIRRAIVDATLEHLFENREIARFFGDWSKDPDLSVAFKEAGEWVEKGSGTKGSGSN